MTGKVSRFCVSSVKYSGLIALTITLQTIPVQIHKFDLNKLLIQKLILTTNQYQPVTKMIMNPKSISMGELYGEEDPLTMEWKDGLMAKCVRLASSTYTDDHKWIICDGPVDALWIENMNTVLGKNMRNYQGKLDEKSKKGVKYLSFFSGHALI